MRSFAASLAALLATACLLAIAAAQGVPPLAGTSPPIVDQRGPRRGVPHLLQDETQQFRGLLVCVTPTSIEVLRNNGVVISALLPRTPAALTARRISRYLVGDKVEITADWIRQFYDPGTAFDYCLELSGLEYLGHASPEQLLAATASGARQLPGNLLALPPGDVPLVPARQPNALPPATRAAMRRWTANLPNYIADAIEKNTIMRFVGQLLNQRTLRETVTVVNGRITRSAMTLNGLPWTGPYLSAPVYHWNGGFAYIGAFLQANCDIRVAAGATAHASFAEPVDGFHFTSPANGCLGRIYMGFRSFYARVRGNLWIARSDHLPRRLEMQYKLPSGMSARSVRMSIEWTPVRVAKGHYLLPSLATIDTAQQGGWWKSQVEYSHYRKFSVSSKITYGGGGRQ